MTVQADPLRAAGSEVAALSDALRRGGGALESVPAQIKDLLRCGSWRHFVTRMGKEVEHERFEDFAMAKPLAGLGADLALVRRLVEHDTEALDLLDRALANPVGANQHGSNITTHKTGGTSKEQALRRLRKDRPDLHAEVLAGNLSAHAAAVQAGFRRRTVTVPVDSAESAASALRKHLTPEQLSTLARLLQEG